MRQLARAFLVTSAVLLGTQCNTASADTSTPISVTESTLVAAAGNVIPPSYPIYSPNGQYFIQFQADGNLVIYHNVYPLEAIWSSGTSGSGAQVAVFQNDGNFVLYRNINDASSHVWDSETGGVPDGWSVAQVRLWNDGSLSINGASGRFYESAPAPEYWSSGAAWGMGSTLVTWSITPQCVSGRTTWTSWMPTMLSDFDTPHQMTKPYGTCSLN